MSEGKLIVFSAPSGAGKTSIVHKILERRKGQFFFSVSATTRNKREGEEHGKDYFFLDCVEFQNKVNEGAFIEWQMVYKDCYYGTLKSEINSMLADGKNILFDIDVKGGISIKNIYQEQALSIFIKPPSVEILRDRLAQRGTETEDTLAMRVNKSEYEMTFADCFDKVIVNDILSVAVDEADKAIEDFLMS
jgi:guanylate kinase